MIPAVRRFLLLVALYTGAVLAAIGPPLGAFGSEFISTGLPGYGEAASGDHLQAAYRFWLVGHQLLGGHAPWIDPYSFQPLVDPQVVFGGWPFGLALLAARCALRLGVGLESAARPRRGRRAGF